MDRISGDISHAVRKILLPNIDIVIVSAGLIWASLKLIKFLISRVLGHHLLTKKKTPKHLKGFSEEIFKNHIKTLVELENGVSSGYTKPIPSNDITTPIRRRQIEETKELTIERCSKDITILFKIARRNRVRLLKKRMDTYEFITKSLMDLKDPETLKYLPVAEKLLVHNEHEKESYNDNSVGAILVEHDPLNFHSHTISNFPSTRSRATSYRATKHERYTLIAQAFLKASTSIFIPTIVENKEDEPSEKEPTKLVEGMQWISEAWKGSPLHFDVISGDVLKTGYTKNRLFVATICDVRDAFTIKQVKDKYLPDVPENVIKFANAFAMFPKHGEEMFSYITDTLGINLSTKEEECLNNILRHALLISDQLVS
ncbi:MAG: hypothetical protein KAH32_05370 [Chlamydiia bacterium]|nr:hypothetical protein [Chlamydiia bacterium]